MWGHTVNLNTNILKSLELLKICSVSAMNLIWISNTDENLGNSQIYGNQTIYFQITTRSKKKLWEKLPNKTKIQHTKTYGIQKQCSQGNLKL